MSDKNSSFINLSDLPDSIDNAVKNLTDKPTQGIGQTFSDVWYLVFGGITQVADKRRITSPEMLQLRAKILYHLRNSRTTRTFVWLLFLYHKLHIL